MPTWRDSWEEAQAWESGWWGDCVLTLGEEMKQITYADRMGLSPHQDEEGRFPVIDLEGRSIVDIGGGPCSMLLRAVNPGRRVVIDPCAFPPWVTARYENAGIQLRCESGEDWSPSSRAFNEAWIYNVLQHTLDPWKVIQRAQRAADVIRVFEWLHTERNVGHLHAFEREELDEYFGGRGVIEQMQGENRLYGTAYYGVFRA